MRCPGQDTRYWREDAIFEAPCPFCGEEIEFFKDDTVRKCPACGRKIPNPRMDFGCAAYCRFADQCLGDLPPELLAQRGEILKERVGLAVKRIVGNDFKRLERVLNLVQKVETLTRVRKQSPGAPLIAAYLFFLNSEERQKVFKEAHVPEILREEILSVISGLGEKAEPEDFLKEDGND